MLGDRVVHAVGHCGLELNLRSNDRWQKFCSLRSNSRLVMKHTLRAKMSELPLPWADAILKRCDQCLSVATILIVQIWGPPASLVSLGIEGQ